MKKIKKLFCAICFCFLLAMVIIPFNNKVKASDNKTYELPILMYHSVQKQGGKKYIISTKELENDFITIKKLGYTPITMTELINFSEGNGILPEKPIIITFDDGFYNNYVNVCPLLEKYNYKAIIAIVGSFCDSNKPYLAWELVKEMSDSGYVEIQNHSYNLHSIGHDIKGISKKHSESSEQYKDRLLNDIGKLQVKLKDSFGIVPNTFVYPFGVFNNTAKQALLDYGFKAMLTCTEGINKVSRGCDLTDLKRYNRPGNVSSDYFFTKKCVI